MVEYLVESKADLMVAQLVGLMAGSMVEKTVVWMVVWTDTSLVGSLGLYWVANWAASKATYWVDWTESWLVAQMAVTTAEKKAALMGKQLVVWMVE